MKPLRLLFVVFFALSTTVALSSAVPSSATPIPNGLSAADWAALQALLPSTYLKASNTEAGDEFGYAIAIDGDTVVVGTRLEDSNATGANGNQADNSANRAGAVYVFTLTDGVWSQQAYLKATNAEAGDFFW